jgi:hypothetical protein
MSEIHQSKPFVPQGATTLIIGTFPPLTQYRNFKFIILTTEEIDFG